MVKPELGTKRVDPETGKKFYDLGRDPVISPYTGKSYPLSYFESAAESQLLENTIDDEEIDVNLDQSEILNLEEAEEKEVAGGKLSSLDEDEVDLVDDEDNFLDNSEDESSDKGVKEIIGEPYLEDE